MITSAELARYLTNAPRTSNHAISLTTSGTEDDLIGDVSMVLRLLEITASHFMKNYVLGPHRIRDSFARLIRSHSHTHAPPSPYID